MTIKDWAWTAFALVLIVAVLIIGGDIHQILVTAPKTLNAQINATRSDLMAQMNALRLDINGQLNGTRGQLNSQMDATRSDLTRRMDQALVVIDHRLGDLTNTIGPSTAGAVSELSIDADRLTQDVGEVKDRFLQREPMYYSRFLATTGELDKTLDAGRRMAEEGAKAAPVLVQDGTAIANDTTVIVAAGREFLAPKTPPKKPPFYVRWLPTIVVTAGKIFF